MSDILDDLRAVQKLRGDTYSSMEVLGMVGRGADEIERLRANVLYWAEHESDTWRDMKAEIERLKAALRGIADAATVEDANIEVIGAFARACFSRT